MSDGAAVDSGTTEGTSEQSGGQDYSEQFRVMNEKIDSIAERFPEQSQEPTGDFASRLSGTGQEPEQEIEPFTDEELDQLLGGDGFDDEGDLDVAAFDQLVNERVQDQVQQHVDQVLGPWQQKQQDQALNALAEKYEDIGEPEIFDPMMEFLGELENRHQVDGLATDPAMVEMAYQAVKAQRASANEVSAETAATGEATLETGAGPSQQGEADPADEYMRGVESGSASSGAFG